MKLNTKTRVLEIALKVEDESVREIILTPIDELSISDITTLLDVLEGEDYMIWYNENVKWSYDYGPEPEPIATFHTKDLKKSK